MLKILYFVPEQDQDKEYHVHQNEGDAEENDIADLQFGVHISQK